MATSKKPALIVGLLLLALIILPVLFLFLPGKGGGGNGGIDGGGNGVTAGDGGDGRGPERSGAVANFDLQRLADRAGTLVEEELGAALQAGDFDLERMAALRRELDTARSALSAGREDRAEAGFETVIARAESALEAIALADRARGMRDDIFSELERLAFLESNFANTYGEAVEHYDAGSRQLRARAYTESVAAFEMADAILGDLEARASRQIAKLVEAGEAALEDYDLEAARQAFREALELQSDHPGATAGLDRVKALEGIADAVRTVRELEAAGRLEAALDRVVALAEANPGNAFLEERQAAIEARILERDRAAKIAEADAAEAAGDLAAAVDALEAAHALKAGPDVKARIANLTERMEARRLDGLLEAGYAALQAGRYEAARDAYREAAALAPNSEEAGKGYETASSLYLANIRYRQNLTNAARYIEEGRFPLAAKFFNSAMGARPNRVSDSDRREEARLREILDRQSKKVRITLKSDRKTFVSVIGVLPPERFREKELSLFPDVYTVKGTRSGYRDVEKEIQVKVGMQSHTFEIEANQP